MFSMGIMLMPTTMNATMVRMMENWENPCFFAPVSFISLWNLDTGKSVFYSFRLPVCLSSFRYM